MSKKGYKQTKEHKRKIGLANKGKKHTEKQNKEMSEIRKKNPIRYWLGKKRPPLSKEQIKNHSIGAKRVGCGKWMKGRGGNKSPSWKGGITPKNVKIRTSIESRLWREAVFARDNWVCQKCGDNKGGNLNSHHIQNFSQYPKQRFAIDNGITFCRNCHKIFHSKYGQRNNNEKQLNEYSE